MMTKKKIRVTAGLGIWLGAVLSVAILASDASAATAAPHNRLITESTCGWWDRAIGGVLPPNTLRCAAMDTADGFWHAVAAFYMRPRGMTISADFLEHSLLDKPGPIHNHSGAVKKLPAASEIESLIRNLAVGHYNNFHAKIELRADLDLFAAFQHADVYLTGVRTATGAQFRVSVRDEYTFHYQDVEVERRLITLGANGAWLSQLASVIHPFRSTTDFTFSANYPGSRPAGAGEAAAGAGESHRAPH